MFVFYTILFGFVHDLEIRIQLFTPSNFKMNRYEVLGQGTMPWHACDLMLRPELNLIIFVGAIVTHYGNMHKDYE